MRDLTGVGADEAHIVVVGAGGCTEVIVRAGAEASVVALAVDGQRVVARSLAVPAHKDTFIGPNTTVINVSSQNGNCKVILEKNKSKCRNHISLLVGTIIAAHNREIFNPRHAPDHRKSLQIIIPDSKLTPENPLCCSWML